MYTENSVADYWVRIVLDFFGNQETAFGKCLKCLLELLGRQCIQVLFFIRVLKTD